MKMMTRFLSVVLLLLTLPLGRAQQAVTQEQCQQADAQLNQVYQQLRGTLNDAQKQQLKTAQRQWIKKRDTFVAANPGNPQGALYQATMQRVNDLEAFIQKINSAKLQASIKSEEHTMKQSNSSAIEDSKLWAEAQKLKKSGDPKSAIPLLERVLAIEEKNHGPQHPNVSIFLKNLGYTYHQMGDYAKEIPLFERAMAIDKKTLGPQHPDVSIDLLALGYSYQQVGDYTKSVAMLERALVIFEKAPGPQHPSVTGTLESLGVTYSLRGDYGDKAKAVALYERALAIQEKSHGPQHPNVASIYNNLGNEYSEMGDYAKAIPLYERALVIYEKARGPQHPSVGNLLNNLAVSCSQMGDDAKAVALYERALAIREKSHGSKHPDVADTLENLGNSYAEMGDYTKAMPLYERALAIKEKALGPEHPRVASLLKNLGNSYAEMGDCAKAIPLYAQALAIGEKTLGPQHPFLSSLLKNQGVAYSEMGDYAKAIPLIERALAIDEKALGPQHPWTALDMYSLGVAYIRKGDLTNARVNALRWSASQKNSLQQMLNFGEVQRLAWAARYLYFDLPAVTLKPNENDELILRWKGIVLDSLMEDRAMAKTTSTTEEGKSSINIIQSLKFQIAKLAISSGRINTDKILKLQSQIDSLESGMAQNVHLGGRVRESAQVRLDQLQANLSIGDAVLDFIIYNDKKTGACCYGLSILYRGGDPKFLMIGGAKEINNALEASRKAIASGDEVSIKQNYAILSEKLWKPLAEALPSNTKKLYIGADGPLNFLSFATLQDEKGNFLGEDYDIAYVGTGRDLLRKPSRSAEKTLVLYANPEFSKDGLSTPSTNAMAMRAVDLKEFSNVQLPALPGTKVEAKAVSSVAKDSQWKSEVHLGADATKASIMQLKSPAILHLATHGFFLGGGNQGGDGERGMKVAPVDLPVAGDSMNVLPTYKGISPMRQSGVALTGGQSTLQAWGRGEFPDPSNDGILTAEEVAGLDLNGTWLVTLSACDTGVGQVQSGEGVFGLRRAFMMAGAQNLLMTLWPVSDEVTPKIMADFYCEVLKTGDAAGSLAKVQRDWLVKLRKEKGLLAAVRDAGPFSMVVMANPHSSASSQ